MYYRIIERLKCTKQKCPRCGAFLYESDLPEYTYLCKDCDENFYSCEV